MFGYDLLDRVTSSQVTVGGSVSSDSYDYDAIGNLRQKGGKAYLYGAECGGQAAGPHAVCSVGGGGSFAYDPEGNQTCGQGRSLSYNLAGKVVQISTDGTNGGGAVVQFAYGADGNRVLQSVTSGTTNARIVYVGLGATGKSLYERTTTAGGSPQHVHFIYAGSFHGGNAFALRVMDGSGTSNKYYSFDHLGSVTAMSDDNGRVANPANDPADANVFGYDVWGARRNPDGQPASPASFNQQVGHREFTGHETIPDVGLINMNGRVYDPVLGRFLSPDPNIQSAGNLQSYNRYSYVLNNPLRYTDPTGCFSFLGLSGTSWVDIGIGLVGIAACGTGVGCSVAFALVAAAYNGTAAIASGASFDQVFAATLVGAVSGTFGGLFGAGTGGLVGNAIGGTAGAWSGAIVGGATAGALSAVCSSPFNGFQNFGTNVLLGAATGAAMSAANLGYQ